VDDVEARARVARVEELLDEVESLGEARAAAKATELVQALLDLYGEGLARVLAHAAEAGGESLPATLAGDELVAHLLLLHDLHPEPLEERVRDALEEVRPYLESHGGDVELLGVGDGVARLRMRGSCDGCPSSATTLKLAVEDVIHKAAPEIEEVRAEGAAASPNGESELTDGRTDAQATVIQLPLAGARDNGSGAGIAGDARPSAPAETAWATAGALPELANGGTALKQVAGEPLLFLKIESTPYAYRPACPRCGESLEEGSLAGSALTCAHCGSRYDIRRAGRSLENGGAPLEPVPLLETDAGLVKVALGSTAVA
jgi:Fe-S cluster biogenesis protein NfuA/nitrite reductase/ring-hydroxylating ferredoxin subunit